jgi:hypothetical protein
MASPGISRLERSALQRIAAAGAGQYFELDRDGDRHVANTIVADGRRLAPATALTRTTDPLHWWFVAAAALLSAAGLLCVTRRGPLSVLLAGSVAGLLIIAPVLW